MFAFYARQKFHLLSLVVASLVVAGAFWGFSAMVAASISVFIVVATCSVFLASRDKVTTMSLLPLWTGKGPDKGQQ